MECDNVRIKRIVDFINIEIIEKHDACTHRSSISNDNQSKQSF